MDNAKIFYKQTINPEKISACGENKIIWEPNQKG
jgi:hypothetical protein